MIQPLKTLCLIKLDEQEQKTKSGIIVREAWKTAPETAVVLEVSRNVQDIKKGDRVQINPYAVIKAKVKDEGLHFIREDDILAVL